MVALKPYPKYKDSGVEWIGEIPEDWEVTKIKHMFKNPSSLFLDGNWIESNVIENKGVRYLTTGNIGIGKYKEQGNGYVSFETFKKLKCLKAYPGDIAISRLNEPIGRSCLLPSYEEYYVVAVDIVIFRPDLNFNKSYIIYAMNNKKFSEQAALSASGATMLRISRTNLENLALPMPNLLKQKQIALYLDRKTSEIDLLIVDKQRLINLLEEKRQAIITETVTKGLDPNVKMKDSGIEWIGEIPEHWDIKKIKHVTSYVGSGKTPRGGGEIYSKDGVVFLRSQNIHYEGLKLSDVVYISKEINDDMENTKVFPNDILLNITGASIGRTCIVPREFPEANVNQHVCIIRPKENKIESELLSKIMASKIINDQILMLQDGSSREGLNFPQIKNLIFPLSRCANEHIEISKYIEEKSQIIFQMKSKIYNQIQKLQEYRESLIYEAITGKVDLREE